MKINICWKIQRLKITQPDLGEQFEFVESDANIIISDNLDILKQADSSMRIFVTDEWNEDVCQNEISIVSPSFVKNELFNKLLNRSMTHEGGIGLEEFLGDELKRVSNFKIMDHKVRGQYSDLFSDIVDRFEGDSLRSSQWLNQWMIYWGYLSEKGIAQFPIEADVVDAKNKIVCQLIVPVENYFKDYLLKGMSKEIDFENPFANSLRGIEFYSTHTDITYIEDSKIILLTGVWAKESKPKFGGISFHQIPSFKKKTERDFSSYRLELVKEAALKGENLLPGESVEPHELSEFEKSSQLLKIQQFVKYIKGKGIEEDKIVISALPQMVEEFIKISGGESFNSNDLKLAFRALKNKEDLEEMNLVVKSLENALPLGDEVHKVIDNLKNRDVEEIIKISGMNATPEERTVISGVTQKITNENWKVKRLEVAQKLEETLSSKKVVTSNDVKEALNEIFEQSMGFNLPGLSEAISQEGLSHVQENFAKHSSHSIDNQMKVVKLETALKMRNQMIGKMKGVVEELKVARQSASEESIVPEQKATSDLNISNKSVETELRLVKGKLDILQKSHNELMQEKQKIEDQYKLMQLEVSRAKNTQENQEVQASSESQMVDSLQLTIQSKNQQLDKITNELRSMEDMNKAMNLKVKSLEQKNKIMQSQIETSNQDSNSDATKVDTRFVQKIKQLENLSNNLQEENKKLQSELQARKAEAHKFALENKTMKTKMHQLERQVANLSKKRAG